MECIGCDGETSLLEREGRREEGMVEEGRKGWREGREGGREGGRKGW